METAGRSIDDEELREAMKDSGLGTPATRADTIERLLNVGYIEREGKALVATTKGRDTIELLGTHALTSAELTGSWEKRLSEIEHGQADRAGFMADIARFTEQLVDYFRDIRTESLGACPNGDGDVIENRSAFGCSSYQSKKEPGCGFTIWKTQAGFTIDRDQVRALLEKGEVELHGPVEARLVLAEGNTPAIVDAAGAPIAQTLALGPCPNGDGDIRENRAAFGCSSYKSKKEPGCGFTIWKSQGSFTITADDVRQLLEQGEAQLESATPARLVLVDGNQPAIVDPDGKPLTGALGPCPNGDGEIKENRRAFGCSSWKSKDEPGCGFTIWKSQKGYVVNEAEVRALLEHGEATLAEGPQPAKLVLGEGNVPQIVGLDGAPLVRASRRPCATRDDRHLPALRRRDPRQQPRLRLLVVEEPQEPRVRLRDLEVDEGPRDHARAGQAGDRAGQHRAARVPRPAGRVHRAAGDDRRQIGRGRAGRLGRSCGVANRPNPLSCAIMDAVVTGGAGFIGSHVADALLERGGRVAVIDNLVGGRRDRVPAGAEFHELDIRDHDAMQAVFDDLQPAAVFHLAAQADVRASVEDPGFDADVNVRGTIAVLECARSTGARVVFSSTGGALYGEAELIPSPEATEPAPMSPYGTSKHGAELYLGLFNRLYGTRHVVLRYSNVYGPRQDPHGEAGVVAIFFGKLTSGETPLIFGDGTPDPRLRLRGRRGGGQHGGAGLRGTAPGLQHRHPDRDRRDRPAGRVAAGGRHRRHTRAPAGAAGRARPQLPRHRAGAARAGLAAGDAARGGSGRDAARPAPVSVVSQGPAAAGLVALTFDDGPGPQTPDILDLFRQHGGHGTFFVLGESVEGREEILARTIAEGHEIGNHTFSHPHAMDATDDELAHDIARCQRLLGHAPVLFRPPYGEDALRCSRIAEARMLPTTVLWSVDPSDWLERDHQAIATVILDGLAPGAIIDLHDCWPRHTSTEADRTPTVEALRIALPEMGARGYRSVTVSELLAAAPIAPG